MASDVGTDATMPARGTVRLVLTHLLGAVIAVSVVLGFAFTTGPVLAVVPTVVLVAATLGTGWLLATRVPRNVIGWTLLAIAAIFVAPLGPLADGLRTSAPGAAQWLYWFVGEGDKNWAWTLPVWALLIWIPLHFPDGRVPTRRWRAFEVFTVVLVLYAATAFATTMDGTHGMANPALVRAFLDVEGPLMLVAGLGAVAAFVGTVVSLVVRYRAGSEVERAQLRWVIWGTGIAVCFLAFGWVLTALGISSDALDGVGLALYGLIPVSIGIAVLRYRLYEIDRIISRSAAYAIVTLVVVGTYLAVVLLTSSLVPDPVGVAFGTLAAAAVFLPVLRWVRRGIDRVFNRRQYVAERVVLAFGEQIRNGADLHGAGAQLLRAVDVTLEPAAAGLWVRPPG